MNPTYFSHPDLVFEARSATAPQHGTKARIGNAQRRRHRLQEGFFRVPVQKKINFYTQRNEQKQTKNEESGGKARKSAEARRRDKRRRVPCISGKPRHEI